MQTHTALMLPENEDVVKNISVTSDLDPSSEDDGVDDFKTCTCCAHKFCSPSGILLVGPSMSGKSTLVTDIILQRRHLFTEVPRHIIYVYACYQPDKYDKLQQALGSAINFREDIPSLSELQSMYRDEKIQRLLIIDDKFQAFKNGDQGRELVELAAVITHHCLFSVFYISQSLFHSSIQREISLNCQYIILFHNARSTQQVRILGSQIFGPGKLNYFADAYRRAVSERKFGYLLIDLHQTTEEKYRLKTDILPHQNVIVYTPLK